MSFAVFTDGCSNLSGELIRRFSIRMLPCNYVMDGEARVYEGDIDAFDAHAYYDRLRAGAEMKTSLLNTDLFMTHFRPVLQAGQDIIYIGMSSGISGTIQAAKIAALELKEAFSDRVVRIVDSLGAGFGTGLLACRASELAAEGKSAEEAADILDEEVMKLLQFFTVDDLNFLKRTGRVSGATAAIGTMLNIKPLLWGDPTGHIVACAKLRGRRRAMEAIVEQYKERAVDAAKQRVAISHGDCPEEAEELARRVKEVCAPKELIIVPHEPFTGAHVGPGMLALFFFGAGR